MTLDGETVDKLETWWTGLSAEEKVLVRINANTATNDERVREVVARSGFPMVPAMLWDEDQQRYRMPPEITKYLADPTALDH